MSDFESIYTEKRKVQCEGEDKGIGHPLVYLEIKDKSIICPYCSKNFILKG